MIKYRNASFQLTKLKIICFIINFPSFLRVQLTISLYWFQLWLGIQQATSSFLTTVDQDDWHHHSNFVKKGFQENKPHSCLHNKRPQIRINGKCKNIIWLWWNPAIVSNNIFSPTFSPNVMDMITRNSPGMHKFMSSSNGPLCTNLKGQSLNSSEILGKYPCHDLKMLQKWEYHHWFSKPEIWKLVKHPLKHFFDVMIKPLNYNQAEAQHQNQQKLLAGIWS